MRSSFERKRPHKDRDFGSSTRIMSEVEALSKEKRKGVDQEAIIEAEEADAAQPPLKRPRKRYSEDEEENGPQDTASSAGDDTSTLYFDTVNRKLMDFDFEKVCSVSLSNQNVYACLVCGKYFQGRGRSSHAYFHALNDDHHVFINLLSDRIYALPEGYEIKSHMLDDIKYVLNPTFTPQQVAKFDKDVTIARDLDHKKYHPGFVGMNNIVANDYVNVVVQALAHVPPLRNFLVLENLESCSELVKRLGLLVRKLWNPRAFKSHVSPHELLQQIMSVSNKKYTLDKQADPATFLSWFLNQIHTGLGGTRKPGSSIVHNCFQGRLQIEKQELSAGKLSSAEAPFLFLTLDLPPAPLFQSELEEFSYPQVALAELLEKYGRTKIQEDADSRRWFGLAKVPPFLILLIKRATQTNYAVEWNHTIVNFSPEGLDMSEYDAQEPVLYDLLANITHESVITNDEEKHVYRVQLRNGASGEWFVIQDLYVDAVQKELLALGETYVQIWQRKK